MTDPCCHEEQTTAMHTLAQLQARETSLPVIHLLGPSVLLVCDSSCCEHAMLL